MNLIIDIGNSNITFGVFQKKELIKTFYLSSNSDISNENYKSLILESLREYKIEKCIIASVVKDLDFIIKNICDEIFKINSLILNTDYNLNLSLKVENPENVGIDRVINAYYAKKMFVTSVIVVDIGSAITFDVVSSQGEFLGGIIMPGLNMQIESLYRKTSKLPKVNLKECNEIIGNSTEKAILTGVLRGTAISISGLIEQCIEELGEKPIVVLTGGQANLISKYMTINFDYIDSNFTLEGLNEILINKF